MKLLKTQYTDDTAARTILRYGAFAAPISMMLYAQMVQAGTLPPAHTSLEPLPSTIITLSLSWLLLGTMTFLTQQSRLWILSALEVGAYFLLAIAQTWLINGMFSPFSAYWVLILVAVYVMFRRTGLKLGIMAFMFALAVDTLVLGQGQPVQAIMSVMTAITILVSSLVIVTVYSSQRTSHRDIIASHAREKSERDRVLTLINNLTDAVFSTDQHGIVRIYNSAALNLLDTNDRIEGRHISDLLNIETGGGKTIDMFTELAKNNTIRQRDDLVMQLGGEDRLLLEATFAPVQGSGNDPGSPDSYVLILRDITRIKSLEEERDEFISVVSHELRTPVTIAEGSLSNAEILAERGQHDKVTQAVQEAHKQVLFLARMVNDLSMLSRAEQGLSDQPESINIVEMAHQIHRDYSPQAGEKGLLFNLDLIGKPSNVHASRLYLKELLQNFITNSIKYTQEGSVTLRIKETGQRVRFDVIDTGIGIGRADQKKIFSRFYRAEDYRTRETSGTGLGLYVSMKIAKKLGCKIDLESRLNHGSTFGFSLPVEKPKKS